MKRWLPAVALILVVPAAAGAPRQTVDPTLTVTSFIAEIRDPGGTVTLSWRAPEWASYRPGRDADGQPIVIRRGVTFYGRYRPPDQGRGVVVRNTYPARPDGYSYITARYQDPVDVILGLARGGRLTLQATRIAGRRAWRGAVALRPNECAGLTRGTATTWLDRATLLPLRIEWRRNHNDTVSLRYRQLNRPLPASAFAPPALGPNPTRQNQGFVRTTPAAADRRVSYTASLPSELPDGFRLAVAGWAPRSARTGPEASNPRYAQLFAAVYRRGWERIDVTQRLSDSTGWASDPFGFECGFETTSTVQLGGVEATYGSGPEILPHLFWRRGNVLHTVSGPFPLSTLVAIAQSLEPIGG